MAGAERKIDILEVDDQSSSQLENVFYQPPDISRIDEWLLSVIALGAENTMVELAFADGLRLEAGEENAIEVQQMEIEGMMDEVTVIQSADVSGHDSSAAEPDVVNTVVPLEIDDGC